MVRALRDNVGHIDQLEWCLTGPSPSSEKAQELRLTGGVKAFFVKCVIFYII